MLAMARMRVFFNGPEINLGTPKTNRTLTLGVCGQKGWEETMGSFGLKKGVAEAVHAAGAVVVAGVKAVVFRMSGCV